MVKLLIAITTFLLSFSALAYRTVYVSGQATENTYCNANSGFFCLDNAKRRAESDAERDARWSCEMSYRGRALTYTTSLYTTCNPSYLPPNHDGTWVYCRSEARMQCEVND
ncbi:MAG: hypothetical protein KUL82_01255 [Bdellovibrio sp.]|nr:hypothetical protein [Bdellovibrio sp.]